MHDTWDIRNSNSNQQTVQWKCRYFVDICTKFCTFMYLLRIDSVGWLRHKQRDGYFISQLNFQPQCYLALWVSSLGTFWQSIDKTIFLFTTFDEELTCHVPYFEMKHLISFIDRVIYFYIITDILKCSLLTCIHNPVLAVSSFVIMK